MNGEVRMVSGGKVRFAGGGRAAFRAVLGLALALAAVSGHAHHWLCPGKLPETSVTVHRNVGNVRVDAGTAIDAVTTANTHQPHDDADPTDADTWNPTGALARANGEGHVYCGSSSGHRIDEAHHHLDATFILYRTQPRATEATMPGSAWSAWRCLVSGTVVAERDFGRILENPGGSRSREHVCDWDVDGGTRGVVPLVGERTHDFQFTAVACITSRGGRCAIGRTRAGDSTDDAIGSLNTAVAAVPDVPAKVGATVGSKAGEVSLSWDEAETDAVGLTVVGSEYYEYRYGLADTYPGGFGPSRPLWNTTACASGSTEYDCRTSVENLPYGEYRFEVRVGNFVGPGAAKEASYGTNATSVAPKVTAPTAPKNPAAKVGHESVVLTWEPPDGDGGAPVESYQYCFYSTDAASCGAEGAGWVDAEVDLRGVRPDLTRTVTSTEDAPLKNGTPYRFRLRAVNEAGVVGASAEVGATPRASPAAPRRVAATVGDRRLTLAWDPPPAGDTATVLRYEFRFGIGGTFVPWQDAKVDLTSSSFSKVVTDLANGVEHTFEVRAVSASGPSLPIEVRATPGPAPLAPTGLAHTQASGDVTLTWDAAVDGGRAIVRYECEYGRLVGSAEVPAAWLPCPVAPGSATTATIPNLVVGAAYAFRVRGCNVLGDPCPDGTGATAEGAGEWASTSLVVGAPPAAPAVSATTEDGKVTLAWEAVGSAAGKVLRYEVRWGRNTASLSNWVVVPAGADARAMEVTGLANGVEYVFEVRAFNTFGAGDPGTVSATPAAGLARVRLTATPGERSVALAWEPAADAASILSYEYRWGQGNTLGEWESVDLNTSVTVGGLEGGSSYTFEVRARTAAGPGTPATEVVQAGAVTASGAPAAPIELVAAPGDRQVGLRWQPPPAAAFPVSAYEYRWGEAPVAGEGEAAGTPTAFGQWARSGSSRAVTVGGLTNGVRYVFEVRAVNRVGGGVAATAVATPAGTASAPLALEAQPADGEVRLTWEAPADSGGLPVTAYAYRFRADGSRFGDWQPADDFSAVVQGLTNGVRYLFEVRAETGTGAGLAASVGGTPVAAVAPPSVPRRLVAEPLSGGTVRLTWATPSSDGGSAIVRYEARWRSADAEFGAWDDVGVVTEHSLGGLVVGADHTFEVRAVNAEGGGEPASVTATPASVPAAPARLTAEPAEGAVTLAWLPPDSDGGSALRRYEYRFAAGGGEFGPWRDAGSETSLTVSPLQNGVGHDFEVRAVNGVGAGTAASVAAVPASAPGAPAVAAFRRDAAALVSWDAPDSDGGTPILRYEYRLQPTGGVFGEWTGVGLEREVSVAGLTNDTEYAFEVRAVNATGEGPAGTARATPREASVPGVPALAVRAEVARVDLAWEAPDDGGSPILRYEYRWQPAGDDFGQWESAALDTVATVDNLVNGIEYVFEVRAVNDLGSGEADSASATPADVPGAPSLALRSGSGEVDLNWAPPVDDGGLDVERYEYRFGAVGAKLGEWIDAELATAATVRELVNGVSYVFAVRAINPRGAGPEAEGTATPTPGVETAVMLDAWLSRFGRTVAGHVVDAVDARLRMPADVVAPDADEPVRQRRPAARPGSPPGRDDGGRVRHRGGTGGRAAVTRWAGSAAGRTDWTGLPVGGMADPVLFLNGTGSAGGRWTAWGRLAATDVTGEDPRLGIEGVVATASGGADYEQGALLAGIAVSHSVGRGDFLLQATEGFPARPGEDIESRLTGTYPYFRLSRGAFAAWGLLGRGAGSVTVSGTGPETTEDIDSTLGAFGARGTLASFAGLDFALKSDSFLTRVSTDGDGAVHADASRLRLMVEASRSAALGDGALLSLVGELGARYDAGGAENGGGMEMGGGVEYGGQRMELAARARTLVSHGDASYREWGAVVSVAVKARPSGRGAFFRLTPGWGSAASDAERMWLASGGAASVWTRPEAAGHVSAEAGYGMDALRGRALAMPYVGFDSRDGGRIWRAGWRLAAGRSRLELEAIHRGTAGRANRGVVLRVTFDPWT